MTESNGLPPPFLYVCWLPAADEVDVGVEVVDDWVTSITPVVLAVVAEAALEADVDREVVVDDADDFPVVAAVADV